MRNHKSKRQNKTRKPTFFEQQRRRARAEFRHQKDKEALLAYEREAEEMPL